MDTHGDSFFFSFQCIIKIIANVIYFIIIIFVNIRNFTLYYYYIHFIIFVNIRTVVTLHIILGTTCILLFFILLHHTLLHTHLLLTSLLLLATTKEVLRCVVVMIYLFISLIYYSSFEFRCVIML